MRKVLINRVRIIFIGLFFIAVLLGVRLYFLQVMHVEEWRGAASRQYVSKNGTEERGDIYFKDRAGRLTLAATQESGWLLAIHPGDIEYVESAYAAINEIVSIDKDRFLKSASKKDDPYEEIATRISDEDAEKIRALDLEGVILARDRWRIYPLQERAAHVLGFVGFSGNERVGRYGLERYWQDTLARPKNALYVNFFAELFSNARAMTSENTRGAYGDIITTIEPTVQMRLEETLVGLNEKYNTKTVGGIVMDPRTGEMLALASYPTFDPNTFNTQKDPSLFVNPLVEGIYEMGSTVKPLTMVAGLDVGAVAADTTYYDKGYVMKSGKRISNFDGKARGHVTMQEVLNQSLNTGMTFVVDEMGNDKFGEYLEEFGLQEETGVDLPNEVRGVISALNTKSDVDYASASFGQGLAMTPIAMVRALSSLANGGELVQPHIVSSVKYGTGLSRKSWDKPEGRVIKKEAAEEITRMLVETVDSSLMNGTAKMEHYSIAAKTGTAQMASPDGGYYDDRFLHSFFGYLPAHDARFLVFLFAIEPKGVRYASESLGQPFLDLASFLINYYDIPPDR